MYAQAEDGMLPAGVPLNANVIFVDGTCVFCNGLVSFILKNDRERRFYFAHIQGALAKKLFGRHGASPSNIDDIVIVTGVGTPGEALRKNGEAGREIWPCLFKAALIMRWTPLPLLNLFYWVLARLRYPLFGQYSTCHVPSGEERTRFLGPLTS